MSLKKKRELNVSNKISFFEKPAILSLKNSTPLSSNSNLLICTNDNLNGDQDNKRMRFMNSTFFNDQKILKQQFGVFRIYGGIDAITWFTSIKHHCIKNYHNPAEIIKYFHIFLDSEFHKWLFNLPDDKKSDLDAFESSFYDEVFSVESDYESLLISNQKEFINKFKKIFTDNDKLNSELSDYPLYSFIKLKMLVIKRLYPKITKEDAIRMTIFSIDSLEVRKKFRIFVNSELTDILNYAKSIDSIRLN